MLFQSICLMKTMFCFVFHSRSKRLILSGAQWGSWVRNIKVMGRLGVGGSLWLIGLVSIWYDSAALKPLSSCLFRPPPELAPVLSTVQEEEKQTENRLSSSRATQPASSECVFCSVCFLTLQPVRPRGPCAGSPLPLSGGASSLYFSPRTLNRN